MCSAIAIIQVGSISERKRKDSTSTTIGIRRVSKKLTIASIGMYLYYIMVLVLAISSWLTKKVLIVNSLSVRTTTFTTTLAACTSGTTIRTASSSAQLSLKPFSVCSYSRQIASGIPALNLALDSRQLRFYSTSSIGNSFQRRTNGENGGGISGDIDDNFYSQEWFTTATTATDQAVLSLTGVELEDNINSKIENNSSLSENHNSYRFSSISINGNGNGNDSSDSDGNGDVDDKEKDSVDATSSSSSRYYCRTKQGKQQRYQPKRGYGPYITLSPEERELFRLIRKARDESNLSTTMRVAGGWVRDKLLATPEFTRSGWIDRNDDMYGVSSGSNAAQRLTSKYKNRMGGKDLSGEKKKNTNDSSDVAGSYQRFQHHEPVDIDIALDDMLGREFAELLNQCLSEMGAKTHGVGVVMKNPEKSKHLETATMKVGQFWIDFVNLRAEEYTQDSRIPDLMRIGTPAEDAFRRDLTINSLFYNINNGQVEDWTGRGFDDLRRCVIATPLAPLTTLLDDPLRTLRSVRFAARLRFYMDDALVQAAMDDRVRKALAEKVSRERVGCEVDLMLRSPDPVGAMRLLINLNLARTVFPMEKLLGAGKQTAYDDRFYENIFAKGLDLLSTNYDQFEGCKSYPPVWCNKAYQGSFTTHGSHDVYLYEDENALRYMWYASFLKPLCDFSSSRNNSNGKTNKRVGRKSNRSVVSKLLINELKRPVRDAEAIEKIMNGANDFKKLLNGGGDFSAVSILLSDIRVYDDEDGAFVDGTHCSSSGEQTRKLKCTMVGKQVFAATENDPVWQHAMEFRLACSKIMRKVGPLWRAALFLAMSEHITEALCDDLDYVIEGDIVDQSQEGFRHREIERYDSVGTAIQRIGLVGIWDQKPLMDGVEIKKVLPNIPKGPTFRDIMDEQEKWMTLHPCAGADILVRHLAQKFPEYAQGVNK